PPPVTRATLPAREMVVDMIDFLRRKPAAHELGALHCASLSWAYFIASHMVMREKVRERGVPCPRLCVGMESHHAHAKPWAWHTNQTSISPGNVGAGGGGGAGLVTRPKRGQTPATTTEASRPSSTPSNLSMAGAKLPNSLRGATTIIGSTRPICSPAYA